MAEYTERQEEWMRRVQLGTPRSYPNIACGWPNEEHGLGHDDYKDWAKDRIDNLEEGDNIGTLLDYNDWVLAQKGEDSDNLGFSNAGCDLCNSHLAGDLYAATALPPNPAENKDYIALRICGDCLRYIANGDVPDDEHLDWLED